MIAKVGFACKWMEGDGQQLREHNTRSTTVTRLVSLDEPERSDLLHSLVVHNTDVTRWHLEQLSSMPEHLRMMRLSSDMLPLFTHEASAKYFKGLRFRTLANRRFQWLGEYARQHNIRLSFHPGQFTILVSVKDNCISPRGVAEFEYHARVADLMGYTDWHTQGFSINVHMGGKAVDPAVMRKAIKQLSLTARNTITMENDEFSWSTSNVIEAVADVCPIVLDVHHHWIHDGKHIQLSDARIDTIKSSWRCVRPKLHLAMSRRDVFKTPRLNEMPDLEKLLERGYTKSALRSHSDEMWHTATLDYIKPFSKDFDIMVECKTKNVGQREAALHIFK